MKLKGIELVWITVADIKKSIDFYTNIMKFTLSEFNEEYGWAELKGVDGAILGIAQFNSSSECKPGSNAIASITVENIEEACKELKAHHIRLIGNTQELPCHVKLQTFCDLDGNMFQLCQVSKP